MPTITPSAVTFESAPLIAALCSPVRYAHAGERFNVLENRPWIAQQVANGVNPWLHIDGGYPDLFDRRGLAPMKGRRCYAKFLTRLFSHAVQAKN